jgi:GTP cyclohydrolase FolE2
MEDVQGWHARFSSFRVRADSCESIHSHDAFDEIDSTAFGRTRA